MSRTHEVDHRFQQLLEVMNLDQTVAYVQESATGHSNAQNSEQCRYPSAGHTSTNAECVATVSASCTKQRIVQTPGVHAVIRHTIVPCARTTTKSKDVPSLMPAVARPNHQAPAQPPVQTHSDNSNYSKRLSAVTSVRLRSLNKSKHLPKDSGKMNRRTFGRPCWQQQSSVSKLKGKSHHLCARYAIADHKQI